MKRFHRLTTVTDPVEACSGDGTRLYGGRWNSKGTAVVYAASSLSLAVLEQLVHLDTDILPPYVYFSIDVPAGVRIVKLRDHLSGAPPEGWDRSPATYTSQLIGDDWVRAKSSCLLLVPSVLVPGDDNLLINPAHAAFHKLTLGPATPFKLDARLGK